MNPKPGRREEENHRTGNPGTIARSGSSYERQPDDAQTANPVAYVPERLPKVASQSVGETGVRSDSDAALMHRQLQAVNRGQRGLARNTWSDRAGHTYVAGGEEGSTRATTS